AAGGPVPAAGTADARPPVAGPGALVRFGPVADGFLVPAEPDSGTRVFLVAADDPGVTVTALNTTGRGSVGRLELAGTVLPPDRTVGADEAALRWIKIRNILGHSAFQLGVLERALEMTAAYAREREQFDRPIGSFQAVSQR